MVTTAALCYLISKQYLHFQVRYYQSICLSSVIRNNLYYTVINHSYPIATKCDYIYLRLSVVSSLVSQKDFRLPTSIFSQFLCEVEPSYGRESSKT